MQHLDAAAHLQLLHNKRIMNSSQPPQAPALGEVLSGTAPPPYTLESFRLFSSYNNCIEILNFLECAKSYCEIYTSANTQLDNFSYDSSEQPEVDILHCLWETLISTFVLPGSPQEINISCAERMSLFAYNHWVAPPPFILEPVVKRLYDQVEETIFTSFVFRDLHKNSDTPGGFTCWMVAIMTMYILSAYFLTP